ncbi:unnamed protein product [Calypogeia fissa]
MRTRSARERRVSMQKTQVRILASPTDSIDEEALLTKEEKGFWGVVVNFEKIQTAGKDGEVENGPKSEPKVLVDVLVNCLPKKDGESRLKAVVPISIDEPGEPVVAGVPLSQLDNLSAIRIYIPKDLRAIEAQEHCRKTVSEVLRRFPDGIRLLDPEDDMQVESKTYKKAVRRIEAIESMIADHVIAKSPTVRQQLKAFYKKVKLNAAIRAARGEVRAASTLVFKDELKARKKVLRRLGYTSVDGVVEMKGRVACEISSADELILTELIFAGSFKELSVEQIVGLVSCFVWQEISRGPYCSYGFSDAEEDGEEEDDDEAEEDDDEAEEDVATVGQQQQLINVKAEPATEVSREVGSPAPILTVSNPASATVSNDVKPSPLSGTIQTSGA